jgi:hypothetical protein
MTKERKDNITVCSAVAMLIFGCVLTTIAFFLEPMGVIHDSVLWVLGQCFIYAGGALGIANYARSAAKHEVDERFHDYERRHHRHRIAGEEGEEIDDITTYDKPIDDGEN